MFRHRSSRLLGAAVAATTLVFCLAAALALVVLLFVAVSVVEEGLDKALLFEAEPKEGLAYWREKTIREALPSWIFAGSIWLSLFGTTLYVAYCSGRNFGASLRKTAPNQSLD